MKLNESVERVINDSELCQALGKNAYNTIIKKWNAKVAVERLLEMIENGMSCTDLFRDGPCSVAEIIQDRE